VDSHHAALDVGDWAFLTCGIFLGSHWAYSVLGWGGYWGWDPVENASLMPWLTGTAFSALGDDAGKARHADGVEYVAGASSPFGWRSRGRFLLVAESSARFTLLLSRQLGIGSNGSADQPCRILFFFFLKQIAFAQRAQAGVHDFARIEFSVQQFAAGAGLLHRAMGNLDSADL
jgi:hypothetical protein